MASQIPLRIRRIEDKEKKGSHGAWRRDFCRKYVELLRRGREKSLRTLVEALSAQGKAISCRSGCTFCCYHYVTVSLAQGIVIVDYLYRHRDLLKQFLDNYAAWYDQAASLAEDIDRTRLRALSSSVPTEQILLETRPLSARYFESSIRCPFLAQDRCSIYEVRPSSCASHHAASPPEWCAPDSPQRPDIQRSITEDDDLVRIVGLADTRLSLYELSLPTMIYRLLTEGSAAIMAEISHHDFR